MSSLSRTSGRLHSSRGPGKGPTTEKKVHFAEPAPPETRPRRHSDSFMVFEEAGREVMERAQEASVVDKLSHTAHDKHLSLGIEACEYRPQKQREDTNRSNKLKSHHGDQPHDEHLSFSMSEIDRLLARKQNAVLVLQCAIRCALARR